MLSVWDQTCANFVPTSKPDVLYRVLYRRSQKSSNVA